MQDLCVGGAGARATLTLTLNLALTLTRTLTSTPSPTPSLTLTLIFDPTVIPTRALALTRARVTRCRAARRCSGSATATCSSSTRRGQHGDIPCLQQPIPYGHSPLQRPFACSGCCTLYLWDIWRGKPSPHLYAEHRGRGGPLVPIPTTSPSSPPLTTSIYRRSQYLVTCFRSHTYPTPTQARQSGVEHGVDAVYCNALELRRPYRVSVQWCVTQPPPSSIAAP